MTGKVEEQYVGAASRHLGATSLVPGLLVAVSPGGCD